MNRIHILCVLLFLSTLSFAQENFEGTINFLMQGTKQTTPSAEGEVVEKPKQETLFNGTLFVKGKEATLELDLQSIFLTMYLDQKTNEIVSIYKQPDGTIMSRWEDRGEPKVKEVKTVATKTGQSKKINGYLCFEYKLTDPKLEKATIWAAPELKVNLDGIPMVQYSNENFTQFFDPIEGVDGFVLAMQATERGMLIDITVTVTEKKLEAVRFNIPPLTKEEKIKRIEREYNHKIGDASSDLDAVKKLEAEQAAKIKAIEEQ